MDIQAMLAAEFRVRPAQVESVVKLIDEGNTIPFIARYRKEATGSLDDQTLREMSERLAALRKLNARRAEIEKALTEQGVLTDELTGKLAAAKTLSEMEDSSHSRARLRSRLQSLSARKKACRTRKPRLPARAT